MATLLTLHLVAGEIESTDTCPSALHSSNQLLKFMGLPFFFALLLLMNFISCTAYSTTVYYYHVKFHRKALPSSNQFVYELTAIGQAHSV